MSAYVELLRDPRWQRKRLEVMERDGFKCVQCGSDAKTLNVHHGHYRKGAAPWEYDPIDLHTLCADCHSELEAEKRLFLRRIGLITTPWLLKKIGAYALAQVVLVSRREIGCDFDAKDIAERMGFEEAVSAFKGAIITDDEIHVPTYPEAKHALSVGALGTDE